jgi:N-acetylglucosamine-6-sulfatase
MGAAISKSRRTLYVAMACLAIVVGALNGGGVAVSREQSTAASTTEDGRPNFVLILADDLDQRTTPYWDVLVQTHDLIKKKGIKFKRAFAPTPICCPARATILTGKYGHNTGVLHNVGEQGGWETFYENGNEERTIAMYLSESGYKTVLIGKYLNGIAAQPEHIPPGWTEWYGAPDANFYTGYDYNLNENGTMVYYGTDEEDYATDVVSAKAVDFIARSEVDDDAPFMMYVAPTAPHAGITAAPRHAGHPYENATAPRLPNYNEADVSDKPTWLQENAGELSARVVAINDADYQNRMGSLYAFDEMVGAIVASLEDHGELDNTYLIFVSDNGYNLGAHRLVGKGVPYEESLRIPLVIRGPDVIEGDKDKHLVLLTDIAPTLLKLAGIDVPADMDGKALVKLLKDKKPENWREDFIAQFAGGFDETDDTTVRFQLPEYRAIRTKDYLYVEWYAEDREGGQEFELYDLKEDKYQLMNLLSTPDGSEVWESVVESLAQRLDELNSCSGKDCRS